MGPQSPAASSNLSSDPREPGNSSSSSMHHDDDKTGTATSKGPLHLLNNEEEEEEVSVSSGRQAHSSSRHECRFWIQQGRRLVDQNQHTRAIPHFRRAETLAERYNYNKEWIAALQDRAWSHFYLKAYTSAIPCHQQVLELLSHHHGSLFSHVDRALVLYSSNWGLYRCFTETHALDKARQALREAIDVLQVHEKEPDLAKPLAQCLVQLAQDFMNQENEEQDEEEDTYNVGKEALKRGLDLTLSQNDGNPRHPEVLYVIQTIGRFHVYFEAYEEALQCFETLVNEKSALFGDDHVQVAEALSCVAYVLEYQDNVEGALDLYQAALDIYITKEERVCTQVQARVANIHLHQEAWDEAILQFQQALERVPLASTSPQETAHVAALYHGLGKAYMGQGEFSQARQYLLKSARLLEAAPPVEVDALGVLLLQDLNTRTKFATAHRVTEFPMDEEAPTTSTSTTSSSSTILNPTPGVAANPRSSPVANLRGEMDEEPARLLIPVQKGLELPQSSSIASLETTSPPPPKPEGPRTPSRLEGAALANFAVECNPYSLSPEIMSVATPQEEQEDVMFDPYSSPVRPGTMKITTHNNSKMMDKSPTALSGTTGSTSRATEDLGLPLMGGGSQASVASSSNTASSSKRTAASINSLTRGSTLPAVKLRLADRGREDNLDGSNGSSYYEGIETALGGSSGSGKLDGVASFEEGQGAPLGSASEEGDASSGESYADPEPPIANYESDSSSHTDDGPSSLRTDDGPLSSHTGEEESMYDYIYESVTHESEPHACESQSVTTDSPETDERKEKDTFQFGQFETDPLSPGQVTAETGDVKHKPESAEATEGLPTETHVSSSLPEKFPDKSEDKKTVALPTKSSIVSVSPQTSHKQGSLSSSVLKSPRQRLAKALSNPFRRSSRRKSNLEAMPEDDEHLPSQKLQSKFDLESIDKASPGPITYVDTESTPSNDDALSQITFSTADLRVNDAGTTENGWWEATIGAVVDATEHFLSADSIHDQVSRRKSAWTSADSTDEESDPFDDISDEDSGIVHTVRRNQRDSVYRLLGKKERNKKSGKKADADNIEDGAKADDERYPEVGKAAREHKIANITAQLATESASKGRRLSGAAQRIRSDLVPLQQALVVQKNELGDKHPDNAITLTKMAMLHRQLGEIDTAVSLLLEALRIRKHHGDRREIAKSMHILADTYCQQKHLRSALKYYLDALRLERSWYGDCTPEVAQTLNKIGKVYATRGEFDIAMEHHQEALQVLKDCFGEDLSHPSVAQTLICIGEVYYKERNSLEMIRSQVDDYNTFIETGMLDVIAQAHEDRGSYRMAISFLEEKIQMVERSSGDVQADLASTMSRLGTLSCLAGVFLEAIDYYARSLNIQMKLGCDKVHIARARVMTGTVECHLGQYRKSLKRFQDALPILRSEVGNDDLMVADTLQRIGLVQIELAEYNDASEALEESFGIIEKSVGKDDPVSFRTRLALGEILMRQWKLDKALAEFCTLLESQRAVHGSKHPNMAATMFCIGRSYEWRDELKTAMKFYEASFYMAEEFLGPDHPSQASTLHRIAEIHTKRQKFKKALLICDKVLEIRKETLGERHIDVALTLSSIANCHTAMGRYQASMDLYEEALQISEEAVGSGHPSVAEIHIGKGALYLRKCQFSEAKECVQKGLEIYERSSIPEQHKQRVDAKSLLDRVEHEEMLCV